MLYSTLRRGTVMRKYKVRIREYDYTQYEGEEPDKSFVMSFSRTIEAKNFAEALETAQNLVNDLNAVLPPAEEHEADAGLELPARKSWTEVRFELEVPISPKYLS